MPITASRPATPTKAAKCVPRVVLADGHDQLMPWLDRGMPHQLQRSQLDSRPGAPGGVANCGPMRTRSSTTGELELTALASGDRRHGLIGEYALIGLISPRITPRCDFHHVPNAQARASTRGLSQVKPGTVT
jgi:hypothetical protein